jgi:hypothetical protein
MTYSMVKPCANCPFRRGTAMRLTRARVKEIDSMMLNSQGGLFPCHKTTRFDDATGSHVPHNGEVHCAGALIFAEKNGNQTQMMRIAGRLGMYDPSKMKPHHDEVFDSMAEMRKAVAP